MSHSLIAPHQTWLLLAIIVSGAAVSIWLEQAYRWAARIGGPVLALSAAMVLSNSRVIPLEAPAYNVVDDYLVPVAIPLLLFRANLRRILKQTGPMFAAFHVASTGTIIGALVAGWLFRDAFPQVPEVAGIMTGSYIGGAVNFVALRSIYGVSGELANPLLVADNFIMAAIFGVLLVLAGSPFMLRRYRHPHSVEGDTTDSRALAARHWQPKEISLVDIAWSLALAVAVAGVSVEFAGVIRKHVVSPLLLSIVGSPFLPITVLSVVLATAAHRWLDRLRGAQELGMFLLYLFFFVIGVRADLVQVVRNVPVLFGFCAVMAVSNLLVTLLCGKLLRMNLEELLLSVNATLGGPPTAAAMAITRGWPNLVLPGMLAGLWGYVIGTFVGILVAEALRWLL